MSQFVTITYWTNIENAGLETLDLGSWTQKRGPRTQDTGSGMHNQDLGFILHTFGAFLARILLQGKIFFFLGALFFGRAVLFARPIGHAKKRVLKTKVHVWSRQLEKFLFALCNFNCTCSFHVQSVSIKSFWTFYGLNIVETSEVRCCIKNNFQNTNTSV